MGPGDTRIYEGRVCGASAAEWEVLYALLTRGSVRLGPTSTRCLAPGQQTSSL